MSSVMKKVMLSCLKATELIEKKLLFKLSFIEGVQLFFHKKVCHTCSAYEKQSVLIDQAIKKQYHHSEHFENLTEIQKLKIQDKIKEALSQK